MFSNAALGVVIGLVFIYLLYSLLGTILEEMIATNIGLRGRVLKMAIDRMLNDNRDKLPNNLSEAFYGHPLIKNLRANTLFLRNKPAYITKETFSKVIIDLLRGQDVQPGDSYREPIQKSLDAAKIAWTPNVPIEDETLSYLKSLWADSQGDVQKFKDSLEQWFNEMMDRTTGWYKKYTQFILLAIGFAVSVFFNVDTVKITTKLQNDPKLREQILAQATEFTKAHPNLDKELHERETEIDNMLTASTKLKDSLKNSTDSFYRKTKQLRDSLYNQATELVDNDITKANNLLGIGWEGGFLGKNFDGYSIPGWIITALAISLGAPFWFDLLNKLMKLRGSVPPDDDNSKPGSSPKKNNRVG